MSDADGTRIEELIRRFQALLERQRTDEVTSYLAAIRVEPESLAPYLHFGDTHYTRNLIFKSDLFELLALGWGPGHRSWIHNHRGQHCWMAVTEGTLAVRNYRRLGCDQALRTVRLLPTSEYLIAPGSIAQVDPIEPVHAVWNPTGLGRRAVSLHVYSLPYDTCVSYDDAQGVCRDVTMFYTSEHGVRVDRHRGGGRLADLPGCVCTLTPGEQDAHCGAIRTSQAPPRRGGSADPR